jgi:hypothetical protein
MFVGNVWGDAYCIAALGWCQEPLFVAELFNEVQMKGDCCQDISFYNSKASIADGL